MTVYSTGFAFSLDRKHVVLIEKNRPDWQKGRLNGVGGHAEMYEAPNQTMQREFREETGVHVHIAAWTHFATLVSNRARVHFFSAFTTAISAVDTKTDERVGLFYVNELRMLHTVPNLQWLIPLALMENETLLHPVVFHLESKDCDK